MPGRIAAVAVMLSVLAIGARAGADPVADPRARAGAAWFTDDQDTIVWSPYAGAGARLPGEVELDARWVADVISSASVDVITAATTEMTEIRHEIGVTARREKLVADLDLDGGLAYSFERDTDSPIMQLGATRGFFEDNVEVGLSYGLVYQRTGVAGEPVESWGTAWLHSPDLAVALTLGRRSVAELSYSVFYVDGFQAGPYRRVPVTRGPDLRGAMWLTERVPDKRLRNAWTGRLRSALGRRWIVSAEYRFYLDDWGVTGHTESAGVSVDLARGLTLQLRERGSLQGGADFYEERYEEETRYRTRDRRLSPHLSGMAGAMVLWELTSLGPFGSLDLRAGADLVFWRFDEYLAPRLTPTMGSDLRTLGWVIGAVTQLGLVVRS